MSDEREVAARARFLQGKLVVAYEARSCGFTGFGHDPVELAEDAFVDYMKHVAMPRLASDEDQSAMLHLDNPLDFLFDWCQEFLG